MDDITTAAVFDELEKVALSVQQVHQPGLLSFQGLAGKYVNQDTLKQNPAVAKQVGMKPGKGALFMSPKAEFVQMYGPQGEEAYRAIKRHELTHYMRGKRGKMQRVGTPGLRGLGSTAREELIAHISAMKGRSPGVQHALAKGVVPGTVASVRHAYQGQRLRDVAMGGNLGKAVSRVRSLFRR